MDLSDDRFGHGHLWRDRRWKKLFDEQKKSFSPGDVALDPAADGTIKDADK